MILSSSLFVLLIAARSASAVAPTGLLCDFQKQPALGVRGAPRFSWIVPPCKGQADQHQTAYKLVVRSDTGELMWDSGKIPSNESTYAAYGGQHLAAGAQYKWNVTTWTSALGGGEGECQSHPSEPATFVTALFDGWDAAAKLVGLPSGDAMFAYLRKEIDVPAGVVSASAFVTAVVDEKLLSGYKFFIDGTLVDLGPGRGEAPVWDGDRTLRSLPYTTLDVTNRLLSPGKHVLALEAMHKPPTAMLQLHLRLKSRQQVVIVTDDTWQAWNGDAHRQPGPPKHGQSAGTGFLEYVDARAEPVGWKLPDFQAKDGWAPAGANTPSADQRQNLHPKMARPLQVYDVSVATIHRLQSGSFVADFGRELQGGLVLKVGDGKAGQTVHLACGESMKGDNVADTWGWEFDWTLREGAQILEQHKYMECRFVAMTFAGQAPKNFTLSAWKVHYEWDETDTHFNSSNATLNAVWELSRYTLQAGSLDTYSDSNTRERQPYECDGGLAATARLLVQREYMYARHSHAWTIQHPTWPVEWQQLTAFLGWQDYMATGQPDLAKAFWQEMYDRTKIGFLEHETGLLNTANMGNHIVDWMPNAAEADQTVNLGEFTASSHHSVSNAYCAHGLDLLSHLMTAAGLHEKAKAFKQQSFNLKRAINEKMWNGTAYCDGICSEVHNKSLVMSNMFTLWFGMVPPENIASVWQTVTSWGMHEMGMYGAFVYLSALSSSYYAPLYALPDDGTAVIMALAKCDHYSWCSEIMQDNVTMTRESWHDGTYSHPWGTVNLVGFVWGILGVHQTSPGYASFIIRPKLGSLQHAELTVPTLRGHIRVKAQPGAVDVDVPCNTHATICLPRSSDFTVNTKTTTLFLDGVVTASVDSGGHICTASPVSCGAEGAVRKLRAASSMYYI